MRGRTPGWAWWIVFSLSVGVAGYASLALLRPTAIDFVRTRQGPLRSLLILHAVAGAVALALGPLQLHASLRARLPEWHRRGGVVYALGVGVGASTGAWLAFYTRGGLAATAGFLLLSVLWLSSTTIAVAAARSGDLPAHRVWMLRSFALTFAAVTLRIHLGLGIASGLRFDPVYATAAWLSWVLNLIVVEWGLLRSGRDAAVEASGREPLMVEQVRSGRAT
jgi:hypothetical protein